MLTSSAGRGKQACLSLHRVFFFFCVCRWKMRGSSRCLPPSAPWQTALSSSPRTASSESSDLWASSPRTTRLEPCGILTRASWTRPGWRWGDRCRSESCWEDCSFSFTREWGVVRSSRWRCAKTLETPQRPEPGVSTARAQEQRKPLLLRLLTAARCQHTFKSQYCTLTSLKLLLIVSRKTHSLYSICTFHEAFLMPGLPLK